MRSLRSMRWSGESIAPQRFSMLLIELFALLLGVAALACYVPARRAMRVDSIIALRG